jgi:hypothetical protein
MDDCDGICDEMGGADPVAWSVLWLRLVERLLIKLDESPIWEFNAAGLLSSPLPGSDRTPWIP